ncbi:ABC transporter substrate-binding protein [Mesorhizobium sp. IMUNJ 23232]|uniref:ABC transporter substrate-binding protein n=1 Tax=Mesorhizobium sp. IMUNJ 23232 TaxID=3376064 RepID=UPI0037B3F4B8
MLARLKILLCSMVAACSISLAQAADIDPEGTVTMAWAGPMTSLDPHVVTGTADQIYTFLMYDRLTNVDANFVIQPMLAKSWAFGEGGKTLVLQLRDDVVFHDGTPFNAAAVKANLERAKTVEGSTVKNVLASIASIDVVSDFEVRLNLNLGQGGDLPAVLASSAGAMISPKAIADGRDLRLDPKDAGSGPYMPTVARPSDTVIYVRAPVKYWDPTAGLLKQFEVRFVTQAAARLNGVRAGQFDLAQILGNDMEAAKKLAQSGTLVAHDAQSSNVQSLLIRADRPAIGNLKLREAVAHAIDRDAISKAAFAGNCLVTDQPVISTHWAYNKDLAGFSNFDPEKAAALVEESGVSQPSFDIVFSPGTSWEPQANIVQGMLAKVGIDAKLTPMPQADAFNAFREGQVDSFQYVIPATVDPSIIVNSLLTGGYALAPAGVKDKILEMAKLGTDPSQSNEQRAGTYRELFKLAAEDVWLFPICASKAVWAHKKTLVGVEDARWYFASLPDFRGIAVAR